MESQQPARNHRHILFGLVGLLWGAVAAVPGWSAVPPEARVVLNSDRFVVGSRWTLDILVDSPDPLSVRLTAPTLPPALVLTEGPNIRETSWEKVPGTLSRATKVSMSFKTVQPGIVEVGPFMLRVGQTTQVVPPVTVYLLAPDEAKRRFPVQLRWVVPEGPYYQGQAIPLMLQALNLDTLAQPQELGLAAPPGSLWEKAVGLGEIEINSIGEDRLMNVPWGGWMLIPTKPGTLTVPAVRASVAGLERSVPPLVLTILPLPPEAAPGRAVGDFSYTVEAREGEAALAGQLVVTQEVTGRGNFPYLVLPEISAPGLTLMSRQEGTRYRAAQGGYEGSLQVTWRFAPESSRNVVLTLPGFRSFQPSTGRIDTWDSKFVRLSLSLPSAPAAAAAPSPRLLTWSEVQAVRPWGVTQGLWSLLVFLPGPLFWGATFLFGGRGRGLLVLLTLSLILVSASDPAPDGFKGALAAQGYDAAERWGILVSQNPGEPGLWYNKALACRDAGRTAEAVHAFLQALRLGFQGTLAAEGLNALEEKELLTDQYIPWTGWPTNWLFLALCLSANLAFVFWGLQRLTGATSWLVPLSMMVLVAVTSGVFLAGARSSQFEADGVVGLADGPIRKVPGALAETWMTLKAGTVIRVQGVSDRWVLVQTGYGLEGWVEESGILRLTGGQ